MKLEDFAQMKDFWKRIDEAISRQVNLGLMGRKESAMDEWNGIPLTGPPNSNIIMVPENCPHSYDSDGNLVVYAWPDGVAAPPPANQAPGSHANPPLVWGEPKVVFNSSGVCTSAGYAPGNVWYNVGDQTGSPSGGGPNKSKAIAALVTLTDYLSKAK